MARGALPKIVENDIVHIGKNQLLHGVILSKPTRPSKYSITRESREPERRISVSFQWLLPPRDPHGRLLLMAAQLMWRQVFNLPVRQVGNSSPQSPGRAACNICDVAGTVVTSVTQSPPVIPLLDDSK
jgi:hypothetical protein